MKISQQKKKKKLHKEAKKQKRPFVRHTCKGGLHAGCAHLLVVNTVESHRHKGLRVVDHRESGVDLRVNERKNPNIQQRREREQTEPKKRKRRGRCTKLHEAEEDSYYETGNQERSGEQFLMSSLT